MDPVVIAVAITGSVPRKKDNPAVPVTPAEQIESTHAAFEAGASLVHIHVRNPDESPFPTPPCLPRCRRGYASTAPRGMMPGGGAAHRPDLERSHAGCAA